MWMIWRHVFAVVAVVLSALPAMAQVLQYGWQTLQSTTGTGSGTELDINGYNSVSIDVEMTSTGTVTLKIKGDGSYRDLTCTSAGDTSAALVTSVTSSTQLVCSTFGLSKIQTPITANGGTITVKARVSNTMARRGSVGGGGGGGVTDGDKGDITVSGSGATWTVDAAAKAHALLDPIHTDTVPGSPTSGDLLMSDAGLWSMLAGPTSASERCLNSIGTGTASQVATWGPCSDVKASTGTTYTVVLSDSRKLLTFSNASSIAVTLPQAGSAGFASGVYFFAKAIGTGTATITPTTSTINGASSLALAQNEGAIIWSNGTNYEALRLWATSSGGGAGDPTTASFWVIDEFCGGKTSAGDIGNMGAQIGGTGSVSYPVPSAGHPCVLNSTTTASSGVFHRVSFSPNDAATTVTGDIAHMRFILLPQSVDADTAVRCGAWTGTGTLESMDGVYISYLPSTSTNWRAVSRVGGTPTATSSAVAVVSGTWVQVDIVRNGSNWDFSLNESAAFATPATSTGPASTTLVHVGCMIDTAAAAAKNVHYDMMAFKSVPSTRHP